MMLVVSLWLFDLTSREVQLSIVNLPLMTSQNIHNRGLTQGYVTVSNFKQSTKLFEKHFSTFQHKTFESDYLT